LPEGVDPTALRQSVCLGAQLMAALLVVLALIFLLRRLF
jgi:flagellar biogenesis protein FliO